MTRAAPKPTGPAATSQGAAGPVDFPSMPACEDGDPWPIGQGGWPDATGVPAGVRGGERPGSAGVQGRHAPLDLEKVETTVTSWTGSVSRALLPHRARLARRYACRAYHERSQWHWTRALALGMPLTDRLDLCGEGSATLVDPKGDEHEIGLGCKQALCSACEAKRRKREGRRVRLAAEAADKRNRALGLRAQLLTFTVRDTGRPAEDRARMIAAWAKWRAWWSAREKRKQDRVNRRRKARGLPPVRLRRGFDFLLVVEITPGTKGQGHAHLHVVAWLPAWWDWKRGQRQWAKTTGGNVDVSNKTRAGGSPVAYLVKYVEKGSRLTDLAPEVAADWLGGTYGARRLTCSRGMWVVESGPGWALVELRPARVDRTVYKGWWRAYRDPATGPP